jgi:hypothetical protein
MENHNLKNLIYNFNLYYLLFIIRRIYLKIFKCLFLIDKKKFRHSEITIIGSLLKNNDQNINYSFYNFCLRAVSVALRTKLKKNIPKKKFSYLYNQFPGSPYRLLNAFIKILNPKVTIEIGTYKGMGTNSLLNSNKGNVYTFDSIDYFKFDHHLNNSKNLKIIKADLIENNNFKKYKNIFEKADLIYLDGPKNIYFEKKILQYISSLGLKKKKYLIIDDICTPELLNIYHSILSPKIDLTSFGNWSGTGIVDISKGLKIDL